jgi:hypothetical protein
VFFDILVFATGSGDVKSLNQLVVAALSEHGIKITKQGIDKRFTEQALDFLKLLFKNLLEIKIGKQIEPGWLSSFNRVLIKDGTRFELPEAYKDAYPGSGGSASKAGVCLQFEFDLKSGNIVDLTITPANRPDVTDARKVLHTVAKGDLILRDLGYYAFSPLKNIISKKAFFASRLGSNTVVYEEVNEKCQPLDFKELLAYMKKNKLFSVTKEVLVGAQEKIPVRLVIDLLPEAVYEQRMRKTAAFHKKKGYTTSDDYKIRARFNLFITNTSEETLPKAVVPQLYRIRWQVELIFKILKSVAGVHLTRKMKQIRWLCLLYFKLILMLINWNIILEQRNHLYNSKGQLLSLNKCFKTLYDHIALLRQSIKQGVEGMTEFILWAGRTLSQNHWLERKNKSTGLEKIFYLFYCKSNIYVYIR